VRVRGHPKRKKRGALCRQRERKEHGGTAGNPITGNSRRSGASPSLSHRKEKKLYQEGRAAGSGGGEGKEAFYIREREKKGEGKAEAFPRFIRKREKINSVTTGRKEGEEGNFQEQKRSAVETGEQAGQLAPRSLNSRKESTAHYGKTRAIRDLGDSPCVIPFSPARGGGEGEVSRGHQTSKSLLAPSQMREKKRKRK